MENASLFALKKCEVPNKTVADHLKLSTDFIIDQKLVQIDMSEFSGGAFAKVIRASYGGAAVRVKRVHSILCSGGKEGVRLDLHRFFQECRLAQTLRHPNIVHFYGVVMDGNFPMLVMEELVCTLYDFLTEPEKYATAKDVFEPQPYGALVMDNTPGMHSLESAESNTVTATETSSKVVLDQEISLINASSTDPHQLELSEEAVKSKPVVQNTIKCTHKATIALNIAQGLHYLHTKKPYPIVHRDLSSTNILLGTISHNFIAKIGDFGQSKELRHKKDWSSTNPGTLQYLPPEVLLLDSELELTQLATEPQEAEGKQLPPDQIPEALEPDDVRTATQASTLIQPLLKTSLDMYMYGVLMVELGSQQAPHKWRENDCKDSWLETHKHKTESLNRESILYKVANKCILESPDERLSADKVVNMIRSIISRPTSAGGSFNKVRLCLQNVYIFSLRVHVHVIYRLSSKLLRSQIPQGMFLALYMATKNLTLPMSK